MKSLQIDEKKAKELYKNASIEFKTMLEDSFGKSFFYENIMDRVKTYEDACDVLGINPINDDEFKANGFEDWEIFNRKMSVVAKALNEGWEPDWNNSNQAKYYPWFDLSGGFAFNRAYCDYSYARAGGGSRFCFKSEELAEYAGKQFLNYYEKLVK